MNYQRLMKGFAAEAAIPVRHAAPSKPVTITEEVADAIASKVVKSIGGFECEQGVQHTLQDWQVELILEEVRKLEATQFTEYTKDGDVVLIPLAENINESFIYNLPTEIVDGIKNYAYGKIPLALSPIWYIYLMLAEQPVEAMGLFLQTLSVMIDDNREVVDNDAVSYLGDILARDVDEDEEDDEDLGDAESMSPGEYIETDNEAALEAQAIADENLESETDVPDDDYVEVDPNSPMAQLFDDGESMMELLKQEFPELKEETEHGE